MNWYSTKEVCEMFGITNGRLSQMVNGFMKKGTAKSTQKIYYFAAIVSKTNTRIVMTGNRAAMEFNDDAVQEIKTYLAQKDSWKARFHGGKK